MNTMSRSLVQMNYFRDTPDFVSSCKENSAPLENMMNTCRNVSANRSANPWPTAANQHTPSLLLLSPSISFFLLSLPIHSLSISFSFSFLGHSLSLLSFSLCLSSLLSLFLSISFSHLFLSLEPSLFLPISVDFLSHPLIFSFYVRV